MSANTTPLTPAQRAAQTRKRNTVQRAVQDALDSAATAVRNVSDTLCDEDTWADNLAAAASAAITGIDAVLTQVRASQNASGAQPLIDDDVDQLLDMRSTLSRVLARQLSDRPFTVDTLTDDDSDVLNLIHQHEHTAFALAVDYRREVSWQGVDPATRSLIQQNID